MTVVDDFAADYFVREGLTPKRQGQVRRALRMLEQHAGRAPEQLDDQAVKAFMAARLREGRHVNTVRFELKAVKPFFGWAWENRIIDADRYMRISKIRPPRGSTGNARPRPYKRQEVHRFWAELDKRWPRAKPNMLVRVADGRSRYAKVWQEGMYLQARAIVSLALFGGLRHAEIRHIDLDDVHPDNDYIVVRGKSSFGERQGYREVPYTVMGRQFMAEWLDFRALAGATHNTPWIKVTRYARPNNPWGAGHPSDPIPNWLWEKILPAIGNGWELHRFRHTCATEWLRAGAKLERVSKLLGHASIEQTLCYAELVPEDVRADVRRAEEDFVGVVGPRLERLVA